MQYHLHEKCFSIVKKANICIGWPHEIGRCNKFILPLFMFTALFMLLAFWKTGPLIKMEYFSSVDSQKHNLLFPNPPTEANTNDSAAAVAITTTNSNITGNGTNVTRRKILLWTTFFGHADFYFGLGHEIFERSRCTVSDCELITDRSLLNSSDAVVFHFRDATIDDIPKWRRPEQRWVFFLLESPAYTSKEKLREFNGLFNWTMTYRLDSDIINTYAAVGLKNRSNSDPTNDMRPSPETISPPGEQRRLVAWLVSNCKTEGHREEYVNELKKYVPIDVFGGCAASTSQRHCPEQSCGAALYRNHKFYLSFENSVCRDYVTEKFFKALRNKVVPVVYGGAPYDRIAPSHSYINVKDFQSPRHLADYLKLLDANDTLYERYLDWTRDWDVLTDWEAEHSFCRLCAALHQRLPTASVTKVYDDIATWWAGMDVCWPIAQLKKPPS